MPANGRFQLLHLALCGLSVLLVGLSLSLGHYHIALAPLLQSLLHPQAGQSMINQIVWSIRLPRALLAFTAGAALGLSGATLQGVFRNPLVDPHIIGVTSGSAFGGTLAILLGFTPLMMISTTFSCGLTALGLVYLIATLQGRERTLALILSGIILSGFFAALVSLMQYLADTEEMLPDIVFWLLGSFATASWHKVMLALPPVLIATLVLYTLRWRINLLSLSDKDAASFGVPVTLLRRVVLVCCALLVAAQVAVSGSIAWVGLVIPHLARVLVGADNRRLLPVAFWLGGSFMVIVDDLARTLTSAEIPIGIITALIGAPVFTLLLIGSQRRRPQ